MLIDTVLVDSSIWLYAYAKARQKEYEEIHQLAKNFFLNLIKEPEIKLAVTSYHVSEIIDLLRKHPCACGTQRRMKIEINRNMVEIH